jgi:hypothetical protein
MLQVPGLKFDYKTRVEVDGTDKHASLLCRVFNKQHKKYLGTYTRNDLNFG